MHTIEQQYHFYKDLIIKKYVVLKHEVRVAPRVMLIGGALAQNSFSTHVEVGRNSME